MAQHRLTFSAAAVRELLAGFATAPGRIAVCPLGLSRLPGRTEWLAHRVSWQPPPDAGGPHALVVVSESAEDLPARARAVLAGGSGGPVTVAVGLGIGPAAGRAAGVCQSPSGLRDLECVCVAGPGFPRVRLTRERSSGLSRGVLEARAAGSQGADPLRDDLLTWSRTVGALGTTTWRRLRALHVAVVGCGRSGSRAAAALAGLGLSRLTLIDGDTVEAADLGEMDAVAAADLGRPKAAAVADRLWERFPGRCSLRTVTKSVLSLPALLAAKRADLLFCCVDNPAARLATAALGVLYLKPLLDVGTGVFLDPALAAAGAGGRHMGADVRLVLPGRCLVCLGGVPHMARAAAQVVGRPAADGAVGGDWQRERSGSLASLNSLAVALAVRLLEDFVGGRVAYSSWLHLEFDESGVPAIECQNSPTGSCPVCPMTARADEGVFALRHTLRAL